jgi:hypothetical protein
MSCRGDNAIFLDEDRPSTQTWQFDIAAERVHAGRWCLALKPIAIHLDLAGLVLDDAAWPPLIWSE